MSIPTISARVRRLLVALVALLTTLAILAVPQSAHAAPAPDPDRNSQALTGWGWHTNVTPAQATSWINQGYRITDLEVNSSSPTFSIAYVRNSGTYGRGWWWYYGKTAAEVSSLLNTNQARLIDIEPYSTSNGVRYAVVMVKNVDPANKTWGWYYNVPLSTITNYASANNMRVIDIDRNPGTSNFSAILISNTGVDAKGWWHYYNISLSQMVSYLNTNNARPINVERLSNGNFDVVMQSRAGEYWWHLYGMTAQGLSDAANQYGARIFQVKSRVVNGVRYYDALLINNVNSETTRIRELVKSKMTGKWGFYLKKVGGSEYLTIGEGQKFEPASMIKIVHAVTAMRDIQNNSTTADTMRTWYAHPNFPARYPSSTGYRTSSTTDTDHADVCAYSNTGTLLTGRTYSDKLGPVLVKQTMVYSDNRTTDGLTRYYGFSGLNNTISLAGMTSSSVNHRIGCPGKASPQPVQHNWLTLRDAGRIYEKVQNGTLLNSTHRDMLYGYMWGGVIGTGSGSLQSMVRSEATAAGLTSTEANSFLNNMVVRAKGGSYGYCPNFDGSGTCNPPTVHSRTEGGVMWIPFKSNGTIVKTPYVYGRYWNSQTNCSWSQVSGGTCTAFNNNQSGLGTMYVEMFRAEVKKALATW